jgi:putative dimethyl sulfoxide reductase chaperone
MSERDPSSLVFGPSSALRARRAAYALLARLWLAPPDAALARELCELPGFAEHVPSGGTTSWLGELAVEYEWLLGLNVYPYESIFRDHELMLNTTAAERVAALYADCGFDAGVGLGGAPDHLGLELRLMVTLIAREEQAAARADPAGVGWAQARQAECLHIHLARWAPICAQTIGRVARHPVYELLATLTAELICSDLAVLPAGPLASVMSEWGIERGLPPQAEAPPVAASGDDERGIGQLARELLTPDRVGVFLCRADIAAFGSAFQLPVPIGDRVGLLRGLFEAAAQFDQLPALLAALDRLFARADADVAALLRDFPGWAPHGEPWRARIAAGRALLAELSAQSNQPLER